MILVAEDVNLTFDGLKLMLERACVDLRVKHTIVQCTRSDEIETYLVNCEQDGTPLILILDDTMDVPGGRYFLKKVIIALWNAAPGTWRSRVPIIIYVHTDKFDRLPHRVNSAIIHQIPEAGEHNLLKMRTAIRTALRALAIGA